MTTATSNDALMLDSIACEAAALGGGGLGGGDLGGGDLGGAQERGFDLYCGDDKAIYVRGEASSRWPLPG